MMKYGLESIWYRNFIRDQIAVRISAVSRIAMYSLRQQGTSFLFCSAFGRPSGGQTQNKRKKSIAPREAH
jgi:hypothetical protein